MAAGRTLIRRYVLALTPAGADSEAAVMATAIPPLSGGPGGHGSEATHAFTIADSVGVIGNPRGRQWPAPGTFQCRGSGPGCSPPAAGPLRNPAPAHSENPPPFGASPGMTPAPMLRCGLRPDGPACRGAPLMTVKIVLTRRGSLAVSSVG